MARTPIAVPIPKRALERNAMPRINAGHVRCCPIQDTVGAQKPRPSGGVSPASAAAACLTTNKTLQTGIAGLARRETRRHQKKRRVKGTRIET
jgi:hypothetical protein